MASSYEKYGPPRKWGDLRGLDLPLCPRLCSALAQNVWFLCHLSDFCYILLALHTSFLLIFSHMTHQDLPEMVPLALKPPRPSYSIPCGSLASVCPDSQVPREDLLVSAYMTSLPSPLGVGHGPHTW